MADWRAVEIWVKNHQRSFNRPIRLSISLLIKAISCTVFELFNVQNIANLKPRLGGHSGLLEIAPFDRQHTTSYSSSVC